MPDKKAKPGAAKNHRSPPPPEFPDATTWAAWLYFVDEMTQNEVASTIGVSRVTVIKMLNDAKDSGIVSVQINTDITSRTTTSRRLAKAFGLNSAVVIPKNDGLPLIDRLGKAGAFAITKNLSEHDVISVAWGRTVLAVAQNIRLDMAVPNLTVAQVSASPNGLSADFSPELCSSLFASHLGARNVNLMAPAIVSSPELRAMLLDEPTIRKQFDVIRSANKVVFGVGELDPGATVRSCELHTEAVVDEMVKQGAVGTILSKFLDKDGKELRAPTHDRMIGISLKELTATPLRLCVAGGEVKIDAIFAALKGGFATDFITDHKTATSLLARLDAD